MDFAHPGPKEIPERYPFIEMFFRILDENQEDIQLGLIVIYQLIKAFDKDENWRVEIHPDELVSMPGHSFVIHDIWLKQK